MGLHDIDGRPDPESGDQAPGPPPPVPGWLTHESTAQSAPLVPEPPPSTLVLLLKFLLHGFLLWVLFLIVGVLWIFLAVGLVICGYILGLIIALVILIALYGWVNSWVTRWLWFDVETGGWVYLFHGLLLLVASLLANLILIVAGVLFPWTASGLLYNYLFFQGPLPLPAVLVPALLLHFIVMGFFGRGVASVWEREPAPAEPPEESGAG